ncbi:MAG TPA: hypothetical protein DD414_01390 [Lachnospiraceae bacterium]|nr:hypothetical protein [Lachnospiraceae bacterium]
MKKKILGMLALTAMLAASTLTASAETIEGEKDWSVSFTDKNKMVSNFTTADLNEIVSNMQPGDEAIFKIALTNKNSKKTDWYMTNKVLYSLEDRSINSKTGGGAYTYKLTYTDKDGEETVLFDSDTVGGERVTPAGEGLHAATNALEDFFYLDTLSKGHGGQINLKVALDGETQGNDYQNTLADLQMQFAVEMARNTPDTPTSTRTRRDPDPQPGQPQPTPAPEPGRGTSVVMTGDNSRVATMLTVSCVSGALFLILSLYGVVGRREKEKVKEARTDEMS